MFGPYERRIDKITRVNGTYFFKVRCEFMGYWDNLTDRRFESFGAAAVWVRNYDLYQIKETKTVSKF